MEPVELPAPVASAMDEWLRVHDDVAPGTIEGLYLVGSVALGDWTPRSDIDVVAVVADPSDPDMFDDLAEAQSVVTSRIGTAIDGPYVAWGDLVVPPMAVHRPWVLDGDYHVDGESFEINPVTWYTLAAHGITMRGERPDTIGVFVDDAERRLFVRENLQTYWRGVGERLRAGIEASDEHEYGGEVLEWVVLGVARMRYTWETGEVASKSAAGRWAALEFPDVAALLDAAVALRAAPGMSTRGQLLDAARFVERTVEATR